MNESGSTLLLYYYSPVGPRANTDMETTNHDAVYVRPEVQVIPLAMSEPVLNNYSNGEMGNGGFLDE